MTYLPYLPKFVCHGPATIGEACALISGKGAGARLLAGGTDLLVRMKRGLERPESVIGLQRIPGLREIHYLAGESLNIGALATISQIITSSVINERFAILAQAAKRMALPQVRNRGTIGGNLCNASPAADLPPALIALDSRVKAVGLTGERIIPLQEFFLGPGETVLHDDEILTEVHVPEQPSRAGGYYRKLSPRHNDLATVSAAAVLAVSPDGRNCEDARIVLGAVAPAVIRCQQAEQVLKGKMINEEVIRQAAETAAGICRPISDVRASAEYRKEMVKVLVIQAITQALAAARAGLHSSGGQI